MNPEKLWRIPAIPIAKALYDNLTEKLWLADA